MLTRVLKARIKVLAQSAAADVDVALEVFLLQEECASETLRQEMVDYATEAFRAQFDSPRIRL